MQAFENVILKGGKSPSNNAAGGGCVDKALLKLGVTGTEFGAFTDLGKVQEHFRDTEADWELLKFRGVGTDRLQFVLECMSKSARALAIVNNGGHCIAIHNGLIHDRGETWPLSRESFAALGIKHIGKMRQVARTLSSKKRKQRPTW